jgi:hypothetical protein
MPVFLDKNKIFIFKNEGNKQLLPFFVLYLSHTNNKKQRELLSTFTNFTKSVLDGH